VQNYDWADELIRRGNDYMEMNNLEKSLECFKNAEKLDDLNNDIYLKKGMCYLNLVNILI
jgi:tetratricopeptide (TPR) repeat protein